ncbi:MAG TPA: hypothetical protein PLU27_08415 [Ginsengibacter sp.]|nr:hypothetical protein [Ginsengibacter sp.]
MNENENENNDQKTKHIRFKTYWIIQRAVEEGIAYGLQRAYKHTDNSDNNHIALEIERAVMSALDEIIDFERG